ncbi:MAG: EAL domain-containing protein [Hormoscilla sp.]
MTSICVTKKNDTCPNHQLEVLPLSEQDEITSLVSHELRTPLTSIRGALGLLLSGKLGSLSPQGMRMLEIAVNNTDRLLRLTKAIEKVSNETANCMSVVSAAAMDRLRLEADLSEAISRQEFQLFYQPIVSLETNRITGFEALLRWQHPVRGFVSPAEFIPLAEKMGLINQLGLWVMRQACHQLNSWQQQFPSQEPLTVSVNLSSKQLSQPDLVKQIKQILEETNLSSSSLRLEITESTLILNPVAALASLRELKNFGIQLYMDDFGTGYSSLSRLQDLPIDVLKIDRCFVSQKKWDMIRVIMLLASSLGLQVIAEGVETVEEVAHLQQAGCQLMQGDFFSQPVNAIAAKALMAAPKTSQQCMH